jgi:putative ATP-dependent endonuclease of OLD family
VRLASVRFENHRRLRDAAIEVRGHLVLVGPNDVGKSSVIRCLDLLLGASVAQLYARISVADFRDPAAPLVVEAVLSDFTDHEKALFADQITVGAAGGLSLTAVRSQLSWQVLVALPADMPDWLRTGSSLVSVNLAFLVRMGRVRLPS